MRNILLSAIAIFGLLPSLSAQNRFYVHAAATGANSGLSWADALIDLQTALQSAQAGDEVWVAEGTYLPTATTQRDTAFQLRSGAKLYGGFAGTETSPDQRDWQAHPTVLSGDIGVPGDSTDNSHTILYLDNPDSLTVVDGLVFRFGNAGYPLNDQLATSPYRSGGALYILADWEAFALISNCRFERNSARNHGGAVYVQGAGSYAAAPTFRDCIFERNKAGQSGGAVYRVGNSDLERPDFVGCTFLHNRSGTFGGALYYLDADVESWFDMEGCSFIKNEVLNFNSGGIASLRVGRSEGAKVQVTNCRFAENLVPGVQGDLAILNRSFLFCEEVIVQGCAFMKGTGTAISFDVIDINKGKITIAKTKFEDYYSMTTLIDGAGISNLVFTQDTVINAPNATFSNIYTTEDTHFNRSFFKNVNNIGIFYSKISLISNVSIEGSSLPHGIATANKQGYPLLFSACNFVNCAINFIVYPGNVDSVNAELRNCLFRNCAIAFPQIILLGNFINIFSDHCSFDDASSCGIEEFDIKTTCGPNNLFGLDPLFRDTASGDYSLLPCSPLLDAGSNAAAAGLLTDLAGGPRILGGTVDIGAYEAPAFALAQAPQVQPACPGASNGSIAVSPAAGCEPYTYAWSPQAGNGPELNGLPPGDYFLTLTDGRGRQLLDTVQVVTAPAPALQPVTTDVPCGTTLGGSIAANASGGTPPYHYQWLPVAADTAQLDHLPAGSYALTVQDAYGCRDSATAGIARVGSIILQVAGEVIRCHDSADGWLSAVPVTGAAPFGWLWQGWPGTAATAQPLGPGAYAVTVTDAYGCTAAFTFPPLANPDSLWLTAVGSPQTNLANPNGTAMVTATLGGTLPYQYLWSTHETGLSIGDLTAGTYTVRVTDDHGCTALTEVVVQLLVGTGEAQGQALLLYPNPAADWLTIVLPEGQGERLAELADATGRVVLRQALAGEATHSTLDLRGLPSGAYVLSVRTPDGSGQSLFRGQVVKQ